MILMNKNHTDTRLVKNERGNAWCYGSPLLKTESKEQIEAKTETEKENIKTGDRLGVSSTCFQLN